LGCTVKFRSGANIVCHAIKQPFRALARTSAPIDVITIKENPLRRAHGGRILIPAGYFTVP
jgi:hypothetical protein